MDACRLHVFGASGSGSTTLGRLVANAWSVPHADADDYFWIPTEPPYVEQRPVPARLRLMRELFLGRSAWVLSGSVMGWGESLVPQLDAIVFLTIDPALRLDRLRAREAGRYGADIEAGGSREGAFQEFLEWARGYDDPEFAGRSRARHEEWLGGLSCPVLRLDSAADPAQLLAQVLAWRNPDAVEPAGR